MRSSSSSSSRSKYKRYTNEELIARTHYDCPLPIEMQVEWTITNPERRFKGCLIFIHEENKMLKKNTAKNMGKNMIKSNSDEGCILKMCELKEELTFMKSKLQMYEEGGILEMSELKEELTLIKSKLYM
ncbi:hypothetical protein Tco_1094753 [Tanacetum coccineum]|uniref:Uncharacterized protein n=1 Tax=Tanacetum coccineum TaxID=301880 RepID=A0ABQ5IGT9_9ASTR